MTKAKRKMKWIARSLGMSLIWLCGWVGGLLYTANGKPIWLPFVSGVIGGVVGGIVAIILENPHDES
jgi:glycerol uptake facilitator-like aquaporin